MANTQLNVNEQIALSLTGEGCLMCEMSFVQYVPRVSHMHSALHCGIYDGAVSPLHICERYRRNDALTEGRIAYRRTMRIHD